MRAVWCRQGEASVDRWPVGEAGDVDDAAHRLAHLAEAGLVVLGAWSSVADDLEHDDAGFTACSACQSRPQRLSVSTRKFVMTTSAHARARRASCLTLWSRSGRG